MTALFMRLMKKPPLQMNPVQISIIMILGLPMSARPTPFARHSSMTLRKKWTRMAGLHTAMNETHHKPLAPLGRIQRSITNIECLSLGQTQALPYRNCVSIDPGPIYLNEVHGMSQQCVAVHPTVQLVAPYCQSKMKITWGVLLLLFSGHLVAGLDRAFDLSRSSDVKGGRAIRSGMSL